MNTRIVPENIKSDTPLICETHFGGLLVPAHTTFIYVVSHLLQDNISTCLTYLQQYKGRKWYYMVDEISSYFTAQDMFIVRNGLQTKEDVLLVGQTAALLYKISDLRNQLSIQHTTTAFNAMVNINKMLEESYLLPPNERKHLHKEMETAVTSQVLSSMLVRETEVPAEWLAKTIISKVIDLPDPIRN